MTLGFSEYEARAYLCLLKFQPATAYEISRESGIPSSKVYEIITRLVDKKIFMQLEEKKKKKYVAVSPDEFIESRKRLFDNTLSSLEISLNEQNNDQQASSIWNINEYDYLLDKAERMIGKSDKTVLISAWDCELDHLEMSVRSAQSRDVDIATVHFGETLSGSGQLFHHPIEDTIYKEKGGRGFVLVCDSKTALVATINETDGTEGAWSTNQGFITLAEDYIKHDIYIMKIVSRFDDLLISRFGDKYKHLRDIFNDRDMT